MIFLYEEPLSFSKSFPQGIVFCFSEPFVQKTTQQSDDSCNVTSEPQLLHKVLQKTVFLVLQTHIESTLRVKDTVLLATMTRCASYPIALIGHIE